jgi:MFS family permease
MTSIVKSPDRRFHYGWIIAGVTFAALLVAAGTRSMSGLLMVPIEQEFGWSRATVSLAISVNICLYGLIGPFAAALTETFGVRRSMLLSIGLVSVGIGMTPAMTAPWHMILLWGVVVGIGTGMTALVLGATIVNRWFAERRGLVMGVLTASTATGQLLFLPLLASLIEQYGWRIAVMLVVGAGLLLLPVIGLLMRERPEDLGLRPFGETGPPPPPAARIGNAFLAPLEVLAAGTRSRDFWLLFGTFFICGASTNGLIGTHLIPACLDHGIPEVAAAGLLAMMGIFDLVGTTLSGWLSDRWNNRYLLCWYYGLRGLSLLFLPYAFDLEFYGLGLFAVFYGLDWIATVPPTVRLTADVFGKQNAGMMFGWIVAGHQIGAAAATFTAGILRTEFGGYVEAFTISGTLCLLAALMSLGIGRKPRKPAVSSPDIATA